MKILKLRFLNLNSLYGDWVIDFTAPEIQDSGLFAITGPTGGGKSTILDAICLALYGETPRLDSINASNNEIMSKNTGECSAELEYEIGQTRYLSKWYQKRAHKKADQKLQSQKREISRWNDTDQKYDPIAEKLKDVDNKVAAVTGMDFQRFTRTILLAQGNFAAFLKADDETRSKLLEQITGTDIYTQISRKVHERHREEETALNDITNRMKGIQLLSEDELATLTGQQTDLQSTVKTLSKQRGELTEKITWLNTITSLEAKQEENKKLMDAHQLRVKNFKREQDRLERGERAAKVEPFYKSVHDGRKTQGTLQKKKYSLAEQSNTQKKTLSEAKKLLTIASNEHVAKEALITKQRPLWIKVRALDTTLNGLTTQVKAATIKKGNLETSLANEHQSGVTLSNKKTTLNTDLESVQHYLENHPSDGQVAAHREIIQDKVSQWIQSNVELKKLDQQTTEILDRLARGKDIISKQKTTVTLAQQALKDTEARVLKSTSKLTSLLDGKLLREYEDRLAHLNEKKELELRIQSLEEHRHSLIKGEECALCGSKHHPFVDTQEGQKRPSKITLINDEINKTQALLKSLTTAENDVAEAQNAREKAVTQLNVETDKLENYNSTLNEREEQKKAIFINAETKAIDNRKIETGLKQRLIGLTTITEETELDTTMLENIVTDIQQRSKRWLDATQKAEPIKAELQKIELDISKHQERKKGIQHTLEAQVDDLAEQQNKLEAAQQKRVDIFSNKSVDEAEKAMTAELQSLAIKLSTAKTSLHTHETTLAQLKQSQKDTAQQLADVDIKLTKDTDKYNESLSKHQFNDETEFKEALLDEEQISSLKNEADEIKATTDKLNTLAVNLKEELTAEKSKALHSENLKTLTDSLSELERQTEEQNQRLGTIQERLKSHHDNLLRQEEDAKLHTAQQQVLKVWKHLQSLIGSSDGKKFRNYAQGLTFEWVVNLANAKLQSISDRYLLTRDAESPLQLNVFDNYQGGEERSTKNLSGGESFIISLALALGLSQMVSDNIRMDSLFLDEGFGTLDEETLEVAMDALSALRQDGKLIGVISHVNELKERLTTQIVVTPSTGGKSTLSGAGIITTSI